MIEVIAEFILYYHMSYQEVMKMPYKAFLALYRYQSKQTSVLERIYKLILQLGTGK
jgi:hypothetical protein